MMFLTKISQDHFKMQQKILILGISSFAGASFADYLLNNSNLNIIGTFNKKNKLPFKYFLERNKNFKKIKLIKLNLSLKRIIYVI